MKMTKLSSFCAQLSMISTVRLLILVAFTWSIGSTSTAAAWQQQSVGVVPTSLFGRASSRRSRISSYSFKRRYRSDNSFGFPMAGNVISSLASSASSSSNSFGGQTKDVDKLKQTLIETIAQFRELKERDGDVSIDFGVKGGELNSTSRAPQKIDYYSISKDVGDKAQEIIHICDQLSECGISSDYLLGGDNDDDDADGGGNYYVLTPLEGSWKSLFTTAADANFNKNSTRGAARVQNVVNATKGTITNVIDFEPKEEEDGEGGLIVTEPLLKQLNVVIKATPVNSKRVELQFRYAKLVFTRFFFLKKFRWSLYIPVPGPFITRCIVFLSRILRFGRKRGAKKVPKGYFDLLYLDDELRIHKTGEDNIFVQVRDSWDLVKPLLV